MMVSQTKVRHILLKPSAIRTSEETRQLAEDLREAFDKASSKPAIEQIRDQVTKTLCGGVGVDVDPDNPDQVIITWTPPEGGEGPSYDGM